MRAALSSVGVLFAILALGSPAQAATLVNFSFSGGPFSGSGVLTIAPNVSPTDPNPLCGTAGANPCRADPVGAFAITGVTGVFSDTDLGISNAAITGLVQIKPANPRDAEFDGLVPTSLSFVDYGSAGASLSYNNLFFPDGSPIDCAYPFSGTFLDVFGLAFKIEGGDTVVLWGDGAEPGGIGLTYGVGLTDGVNVYEQPDGVDATFSVPEPATWAMMLMGFFGLGGALRSRRRQLSAA